MTPNISSDTLNKRNEQLGSNLRHQLAKLNEVLRPDVRILRTEVQADAAQDHDIAGSHFKAPTLDKRMIESNGGLLTLCIQDTIQLTISL
jgi:hypothetical protein